MSGNLLYTLVYSSNRNKIQVNLIKQKLVGRKLRVLCGSDLSVLYANGITCDWVMLIGELSIWCSRWCVFMEEGESIM